MSQTFDGHRVDKRVWTFAVLLAWLAQWLSRGHRAKSGDMWDSLFVRAVAPGGNISTLRQRVEECRDVLRKAGELA